MRTLEQRFAGLLGQAGITLNGTGDVNVTVNNPRVYWRFLLGGTLGLGESYEDNDWDCNDLAECYARLVRADKDKGSGGLPKIITSLAWFFHNAQSKRKARQVAYKHYDLGNALYSAMLDPRMIYTCSYRERGATSNPRAQEDKLRLVCEKIGLKPGQRVLDIGCGWGGFAKFAAEEFGAHVVGIANSKEQLTLGRELCKGLPIELKNLDYRDILKEFGPESFDHVVSIGMFEAVGPKNFRVYMQQAHAVLKPGGYFLLHTIGMAEGGYDPWIERYIFPNGYLPSLEQIGRAISGLFVAKDVHDIDPDYDPTLCEWHDNFEAAWPALLATGKYDERFRRRWRYYLLQCAGLFRARSTKLWQIVLSKDGVPCEYQPIR